MVQEWNVENISISYQCDENVMIFSQFRFSLFISLCIFFFLYIPDSSLFGGLHLNLYRIKDCSFNGM